MSISFTAGDVFAALALLLSLVATVTTIRFNTRQKSLVESQELLNQRLLAREESDANASAQADLSANLVQVGKSSWRLKIYNRGRAVARNVMIELPEGDDLLIQSDVDSKFPLERLEPAQGADLVALIHMNSMRKRQVTLSWSDDFRDSNRKTVFVTV